MLNNSLPHSRSNIFSNQEKPSKTKNAHGDVRQDKRAENRARIASAQPARYDIPLRAQELTTKTPRSQNAPVAHRRTAQLTLWVDPIVKAEVQRRAKREELSDSAVGAALLRKGMQTDLDIEYGALIEPAFENILYRRMAARDNRLALLLVRIFLAVEQNRSLTTNHLGRHPDISPEALNNILDKSLRDAKKKLIPQSPDMKKLIKELNAWVTDQERQEKKPNV